MRTKLTCGTKLTCERRNSRANETHATCERNSRAGDTRVRTKLTCGRHSRANETQRNSRAGDTRVRTKLACERNSRADETHVRETLACERKPPRNGTPTRQYRGLRAARIGSKIASAAIVATGWPPALWRGPRSGRSARLSSAVAGEPQGRRQTGGGNKPICSTRIRWMRCLKS